MTKFVILKVLKWLGAKVSNFPHSFVSDLSERKHSEIVIAKKGLKKQA
jgi:hypothetical protein